MTKVGIVYTPVLRFTRSVAAAETYQAVDSMLRTLPRSSVQHLRNAVSTVPGSGGDLFCSSAKRLFYSLPLHSGLRANLLVAPLWFGMCLHHFHATRTSDGFGASP